jgi:hypothetical protein
VTVTEPTELLHGTLDALILKTLAWGPRHGYAIAQWIESTSADALRNARASPNGSWYRTRSRSGRPRSGSASRSERRRAASYARYSDRACGSAIGVALGGLAAYGAAGALRAILFETEPTDAGTFAAIAGILMLVAAMASLAPARRASRVDPMVALRSE